MAIQLDIKPEDIDNMVRDAVLKAGFGKLINGLIVDATKLNTYDSPMKAALTQFVRDITTELLQTTYKDEIVAAIAKELAAGLEGEALEKMAKKVCDKVVDGINRRDW